jgi:F0F1-type ATP synthase delta subunit
MTNSKITANDIVDGIYSYLKKTGSEELLPEVIKLLSGSVGTKPEVVITSSVALDSTRQNKAQKLAARLIKENNLQFKFVSDSTIIDGLKINYKDKVWDMTVKSQLTKLINQITK